MKVKEYNHWAWALIVAAIIGSFAGINIIAGLSLRLLHVGE